MLKLKRVDVAFEMDQLIKLIRIHEMEERKPVLKKPEFFELAKYLNGLINA